MKEQLKQEENQLQWIWKAVFLNKHEIIFIDYLQKV